jgi:hypothetical protein
MVDVTGIRVTDPDVAEVITSRLAHLVRRPALDKSPRIVCVTPCLTLKLAATQLSEPSSQWHPLSRSLHLLSSNSYPTFPAYPLASDTADSDSRSPSQPTRSPRLGLRESESADSGSESPSLLTSPADYRQLAPWHTLCGNVRHTCWSFRRGGTCEQYSRLLRDGCCRHGWTSRRTSSTSTSWRCPSASPTATFTWCVLPVQRRA